MGHELDLIRSELHELNRSVNQIIPDVKHCVKELDLINTEQKIIRTILQKHDTTIDFHTKDIDALGSQIDKLQINQMIYKTAATASGEKIKWATFIEFLVVLPKYWKGIAAALLSLISLLMMAWEIAGRRLLRK